MEKKLFGRFNIIDIILFSIIILAVLGAIVRIFWNGSVSNRDAEITVTFVAEEFRSETLKYLEYDAELINESDDSIIGRVVDFNITDGNKLIIKAFSEGSKLKRGISLDGTTYFVGSSANIIIGDAIIEAYVSNIETDL